MDPGIPAVTCLNIACMLHFWAETQSPCVTLKGHKPNEVLSPSGSKVTAMLMQAPFLNSFKEAKMALGIRIKTC